MAGFGLKCWDSEGNVTLDLTDTVSRLRFQTIVGTDESGSVILPDITGRQTAHFAVSQAVPPAGLAATSVPQGYASHTVNRVDTKILWNNLGTRHKPVATSLVLVFLYT